MLGVKDAKVNEMLSPVVKGFSDRGERRMIWESTARSKEEGTKQRGLWEPGEEAATQPGAVGGGLVGENLLEQVVHEVIWLLR